MIPSWKGIPLLRRYRDRDAGNREEGELPYCGATGAGKTEAAVLPLINSLTGKQADPIRILYITPLRALNRDMLLRLEELCANAKISVGVRHGDTTQKERNRQARSAPTLLITTPETLQSILPTKYMGSYLRNIVAVVVDELHELYYSKRGAQLSVALERIEQLAPGFQRIGISATIGDANTAAKFLCNERKCTIARSGELKGMTLEVEQPARHAGGLGEFADKFGLDGPAMARLDRISELVSHSNSSLIFANTRQVVESLGQQACLPEQPQRLRGHRGAPQLARQGGAHIAREKVQEPCCEEHHSHKLS